MLWKWENIHYFDWAIFKFANCKRLPEGTRTYETIGIFTRNEGVKYAAAVSVISGYITRINHSHWEYLHYSSIYGVE